MTNVKWVGSVYRHVRWVRAYRIANFSLGNLSIRKGSGGTEDLEREKMLHDFLRSLGGYGGSWRAFGSGLLSADSVPAATKSAVRIAAEKLAIEDEADLGLDYGGHLIGSVW